MLTGYRVLDITQIVAGPTCTRILAEMGADVIKVEMAPGGDRGRVAGVKPNDPAHRRSTQSTYNFQHNHSKRSLALDFKHPRAREILHALVPKVDVVVENFAPGVMARAGMDYATLRAINPRIIMCSISLAGQDGPLSGNPGFDYMAASLAGVQGLFGEPDRPAQIPLAIGDSYTGVAAAMSVGFALLHRERTGEGQYIENSLVDSWFAMHEVNLPRASLRGDAYQSERTGSLHPDGGPTGVFRFRGDAFISIMVLPHQWPQLVRALGQPALLDDPRFATPRARRDNREAAAAIIEEWLRGFPTREAALAALEAERVPCAPVLTLHEAMRHPHLVARGTVRRVEDPRIGAFDIPGLPARFSAWPPRDNLRAALLGEHNEDVLRELLGLDAAEVDALHNEGVLVRERALDPGGAVA